MWKHWQIERQEKNLQMQQVVWPVYVIINVQEKMEKSIKMLIIQTIADLKLI